MIDWEYTIKKVNNGYTVSWAEEGADGELSSNEHVIEEKDTDNGELEAMKELLLFIKESFGVNWSKHNPINLEIKYNRSN